MSFTSEVQVRAIMDERVREAREARRGQADRRVSHPSLSRVGRRLLARVRPSPAH